MCRKVSQAFLNASHRKKFENHWLTVMMYIEWYGTKKRRPPLNGMTEVKKGLHNCLKTKIGKIKLATTKIGLQTVNLKKSVSLQKAKSMISTCVLQKKFFNAGHKFVIDNKIELTY